jgi:hypothetical protein
MTEHTQPLTIGQFITKLEQQPQENEITFDFGGYIPTTFDSYRGFYDQLALGFDTGVASVSVATLLYNARDAQYETFQGYKGGSYRMTPDTHLWADNYGKWTSTAIVDVVSNDCETKIITVYLPV